jgi:hypothetical protein
MAKLSNFDSGYHGNTILYVFFLGITRKWLDDVVPLNETLASCITECRQGIHCITAVCFRCSLCFIVMIYTEEIKIMPARIIGVR